MISLVMPREGSGGWMKARRGIQYAAAFRFKHRCLWNTGSRLRVMTVEGMNFPSRKNAIVCPIAIEFRTSHGCDTATTM